MIPLYLNLVAALRGIDRELYDVADALRLSRASGVRNILAAGGAAGHARRLPAVARRRLARARRRRAGQHGLRPRLPDQQRPGLPADRRRGGGPARLRRARAAHRCTRPQARAPGAALEGGRMTAVPPRLRGDARPWCRCAGVAPLVRRARRARGLVLEVGAGEFVALLGRSGSGKTTLLRALAGLDPASPATVRTGSRAGRRLPGPAAAAVAHRAAERRARAARVRDPRGRARGARWPRSGSRAARTPGRASSPAGSASASRWRARSCASPT